MILQSPQKTFAVTGASKSYGAAIVAELRHRDHIVCGIFRDTQRLFYRRLLALL